MTRRALQLSLGLAIVGSVVVRAFLVANKLADFDELQALHHAWNVSKGLLPYRDFWENHGPATYYLLAPIFWGGREGASVLYAGRVVCAALGLGSLALTFGIARTVVGRAAAWATVALLAWLPIFAIKTIEARPDAFYQISWLAAVCLYVQHPGPRRGAISGALLGFGLWFTPKAVFGLAALGLGAVAAALAAREPGRAVRTGLAIAVGFGIPVAILAAMFGALGELDSLVRWMFVFNFEVPSRVGYSPIRDVATLAMAGVDILSVGGVLLAVARRDERRFVLAIMTTVVTSIYLFVMPTPYSHSALPALPLACVMAATLVEGWQPTMRAIALIAAISIPASQLVMSPRVWRRDALDAQLAVGAEVRRLVSPDDVYVGTAAYPITRRSAWFFNVVTAEVADALARGEYPPRDILPMSTVILDHHCPVIVQGINSRRSLTPDVAALLRYYHVEFVIDANLRGTSSDGPVEIRYRILVANSCPQNH